MLASLAIDNISKDTGAVWRRDRRGQQWRGTGRRGRWDGPGWRCRRDMCVANGESAHASHLKNSSSSTLRAGDDEPGSTVDLVVKKQHSGSLIHVPLKRVPASELHYPSWPQQPVFAATSGPPAMAAQLPVRLESLRARRRVQKSACLNKGGGRRGGEKFNQ